MCTCGMRGGIYIYVVPFRPKGPSAYQTGRRE